MTRKDRGTNQMPQFKIIYQETTQHEQIIEAETEDEARRLWNEEHFITPLNAIDNEIVDIEEQY